MSIRVHSWLSIGLVALALAGYWALLIHQLGAQWSVYPQYSYSWAVPFLCAYLIWQRLRREDPLRLERGERDATLAHQISLLRIRWVEGVRRTDEVRLGSGEGPGVRASGEVSNCGQPSSCSSASISLSSLPSNQSGVEPPHSKAAASTWYRSRISWSPLCLLVLCALLYAPTRLLHEANPIWRLTSWLWTLEVIAITLLLVRLSVSAFQRFNVSAVAFPICFFLVAVPWPTIVEGRLIQWLTELNVAVTIELLNLVGMPAVQHGNLIEITTGVVGVDEACSGIRSFQATLMLSLFFGELYSLTAARRVVLCLLGFASSFFFNICRTFSLTYIASKQGVPELEKWHDPAGITILVWCFVAIWFASLVMKAPEIEQIRRRRRAGAELEGQGAAAEKPQHSADTSLPPEPRGAKSFTQPSAPFQSADKSAQSKATAGAEQVSALECGDSSPLSFPGGSSPDFRVPAKPRGTKSFTQPPATSQSADKPAQSRATAGAEPVSALECGDSSPLSSPGDSLPAFRVPAKPRGTESFTRPSTVSAFSVGLLVWLVLVEVGVEAWYRSHEEPARDAVNWTVRADEEDSGMVKMQTAETVLRQFNADENAELRWKVEGVTWQLYYFRWRPASSLKKRVEVQLAKSHGPEICLPATGMKMESYLGIKRVKAAELTLALQHYVFAMQDRPVHVFYAIYEDPSGTEVLANRRRDTSSRVAAALAGSRNYGQRFLELAGWGIQNEQQAEAAVQRQLERIIRVER